MKNSTLLVFGFLFLSTLSLAATKSKKGKVYSPTAKAMVEPAARKPVTPVKRNLPATTEDDLSVDTLVYRFQKFATELTTEVGYLLKASGPWLKEIEEQIRGNEEVASAQLKGGRKIASQSAALPQKGKQSKRQLGQMSQGPTKILDLVVSVSKETWQKVHLVVADLSAQAQTILE